nr:hypothetical protein K-LCC10_0189 [Kaumoebavirus]
MGNAATRTKKEKKVKSRPKYKRRGTPIDTNTQRGINVAIYGSPLM